MGDLSFTNIHEKPPGGFVFVDPDTGYVARHPNYRVWMDMIQNHRAANGLMPIAKEVIEDQNCRKLSKEAAKRFCKGEGETTDGVKLTLGDIMRGTATILLNQFTNELVLQDEAERRASICRTCIYNVDFRKPCSGLCEELSDIVQKIVGAVRTSSHDDLRACAVCSCHLKAKIHVPISILRKTETEEQKRLWPEYCWMKT